MRVKSAEHEPMILYAGGLMEVKSKGNLNDKDKKHSALSVAKMNTVQEKALRNIFQEYKKNNDDMMNILELLMTFRDDPVIRSIFLLDEVHVDEKTDAKMRGIIVRVVRANRNLTWTEFRSYFCQSQGNFASLLIALPRSKEEAEKQLGKSSMKRTAEGDDDDDDTKDEFKVDDLLEKEAESRLEDDDFDMTGDDDDEIPEYMLERQDLDCELEETFTSAPFETYVYLSIISPISFTLLTYPHTYTIRNTGTWYMPEARNDRHSEYVLRARINRSEDSRE